MGISIDLNEKQVKDIDDNTVGGSYVVNPPMDDQVYY